MIPIIERLGRKRLLSQWTSKKVKDKILIWCNENGIAFIDDKDLKKAKHSGKTYLKINDDDYSKEVTGLPNPYDLTGDPDWNENGKLLVLYDLQLKNNHSSGEVFRCVKPKSGG